MVVAVRDAVVVRVGEFDGVTDEEGENEGVCEHAPTHGERMRTRWLAKSAKTARPKVSVAMPVGCAN